MAAQKQFSFTHVFAAASAISRGVLPRVAAVLDVSPVSEIIGVKSEDTFVRTIYAGNAVMTLKVNDPIKVVTVRPTSFEAAPAEGGSAAEEKLAPVETPKNSEFIGQELHKSDRPELASANVRNQLDRPLASEANVTCSRLSSVAVEG